METITRFYSSKGDDNDMRDGIVYVDGKRLDLDACEELYGDGKFHGSRGVHLLRSKKGTLVWESWSN